MNILSIEGILNIYIVVRVFGSLFEFATNLKGNLTWQRQLIPSKGWKHSIVHNGCSVTGQDVSAYQLNIQIPNLTRQVRENLQQKFGLALIE